MLILEALELAGRAARRSISRGAGYGLTATPTA